MGSIKTLIFVACVAVFLVEVSSQIIGGYDAAPYQFTYQVAIRTIARKYICSGAVLSERWVITAAQCVLRTHENQLEIAYGSRSLGGHSRATKVGRIVRHPNFQYHNLNNDLSMLLTASKIKFDRNVVEAIALPKQASVENDVAIVSGWGKSSIENTNIEKLSMALQFQITTVMSSNQCKAQCDEHASFVHETSLCTKNNPGHGFHRGDVGSPLISKTKDKALIGIASWNNGCANGKPDVYTAIHPHVHWIRQILYS